MLYLHKDSIWNSLPKSPYFGKIIARPVYNCVISSEPVLPENSSEKKLVPREGATFSFLLIQPKPRKFAFFAGSIKNSATLTSLVGFSVVLNIGIFFLYWLNLIAQWFFLFLNGFSARNNPFHSEMMLIMWIFLSEMSFKN